MGPLINYGAQVELPLDSEMPSDRECISCERDLAFLRRTRRPTYESGSPALAIVDLFSGAGGFSLGIAEACRRCGIGGSVVFAADSDEDAAMVFAENFPKAEVVTESVEDLFGGEPGKRASSREKELARGIGPVDILIGGPPCQGHSDLNNRTRRNDPRNGLYLRMVRAAEILRPRAVLIENVPAIVHDASRIVDMAARYLRVVGFEVAWRFFEMAALGIPQTRKPHVLLAIRLGSDPLRSYPR